jgi:hypothetical protein
MPLPVLVSVCLISAALPQSTPPPRAQLASFTETVYDFGTVAQGTLLSHSFTIRNAGTEPLKIEALDLQAPGMKTSFKPVIAPGESVRVSIEWNTARLSGPIVGKAIVRFATPAQPPVSLELKATVTGGIDVLPMPAVFFSVYKGETATRSVTIVSHETRPFDIIGVEPAGTHFTAAITPIEPGKAYRLDVTVPQTAEAGRFMEKVFLSTNHPTKKRVEVAVNVLVKNELYVNPETIDLGSLSIAELTANPQLLRLLEQKLIVRKKTGDFAITSVSTDVAALSVRTAAKGRAQAFQIDVSVLREKLAAGEIRGTIRIETDDERFPVLEVPVSGRVSSK